MDILHQGWGWGPDHILQCFLGLRETLTEKNCRWQTVIKVMDLQRKKGKTRIQDLYFSWKQQWKGRYKAEKDQCPIAMGAHESNSCSKARGTNSGSPHLINCPLPLLQMSVCLSFLLCNLAFGHVTKFLANVTYRGTFHRLSRNFSFPS